MDIRPTELDYATLNQLTSGYKHFAGLAFELKHSSSTPQHETSIGEIEQSIERDVERNFIAAYLPTGVHGKLVLVPFEHEHINLYWYTATDFGRQQLKTAA